MIKTKKQMYLVIGAFALVMLLGTVTYAFFNYTRTGTANTIRTGRISFNTSQSNTLNLTNVFPMNSTQAGTANLDAVSVRIWGDTTYTDGEEFEISIVDVNNTIGSGASAKTIPINYIATYTATPVQSGDPNVIGTNSDSYFTARGQSSLVYQLSATGEATNGEQVLIGYISSGATGIDGTLTIKAYLDSSKIAISDTYPEEETDTNSDGYIDGTPTSFGEGKIVLTTAEWNALQNTQTPLSFKIKAISQEGTWVENPNLAWKVISRVEGLKDVAGAKRYVGGVTTTNNYVMFNNEQWRIIGVYGNQLKIIKAANPINMAYHQYTAEATNSWIDSEIVKYLNETYYDSLTTAAQNMIASGTWYIGATTADSIVSSVYSSSQTNTWQGKVGLISAYEYLYATSAGDSCYDIVANNGSYSTSCGLTTNNWIWPGSGSYWTITPSSANNNKQIKYISYLYGDNFIYGTDNAYPVVYLKPEVTITGGTGEPGGNEYTLGYTAN